MNVKFDGIKGPEMTLTVKLNNILNYKQGESQVECHLQCHYNVFGKYTSRKEI